MAVSNEWLSLPQVAEQLGRSPQTIRRWVRAGTLPAELRPGTYGPQYFIAPESVAERASKMARPEDSLRGELRAMSQQLARISAQLEEVQRKNAQISHFTESIVQALGVQQLRGRDLARFFEVRQAIEAQRAAALPAASNDDEEDSILDGQSARG